MELKIAENIKRLRNENNLTQSELATHLLVSPQAVSRWENGQAYPDIEFLTKLADFFNVSMDELMGRESSDEVELEQKHRLLRQEYLNNGAKADEKLMLQLCNTLEKLCTLKPFAYGLIEEYFQYARELRNLAQNAFHLEKARRFAHSALPVSAEKANIFLTNILWHEDEDKLEQWKKYITESNDYATWGALLERRYFFNHDDEKWEKTRQENIYAHVSTVISKLVDNSPRSSSHHESRNSHAFSPPPSAEHCRLALNMLKLYSRDPFDIFFPARFNIEFQLFTALINEGNLGAGLERLSILKQYAIKLRQMIDEKVIRRGSVPVLSLVEKEMNDSDENLPILCLWNSERPLFDEVRKDDRFISTFNTLSALFDKNAQATPHAEEKPHKPTDPNATSVSLCASDLKFKDNSEYDLCVHGKIFFEVNGIQLSDSQEWCVSASAYRFLLTLTENHAFVGDDNQMIPCCGTIMPIEKHEKPILIGCDTGIDFDITHDDKAVTLQTERGVRYTVPFSEYKAAVFSFAKQIINFYEQNPSRKFNDKFEENGFNTFFNALYALSSYDPDEWRFADKEKKLFARRFGFGGTSPANQHWVIVLRSANCTYTVRYTNINEAIEANIDDLIESMKQHSETKIARLICFVSGGLELPSYSFRDKLCRIDNANLDTLILLQGLNAPVAKPLRATMAKGYEDRLLSEPQ